MLGTAWMPAGAAVLGAGTEGKYVNTGVSYAGIRNA
jgi:hypothetical protein